MASGPVMNPEGQPDSALTRKPGLALNTAYEAKYGPNSRSQFAGHAYDAFEVLKRVIPAALKSAKPGTPGGEILVPGEPEVRMRARRLAEGVPLPDDTWAAIVETARSVGLDERRIQQAAM